MFSLTSRILITFEESVGANKSRYLFEQLHEVKIKRKSWQEAHTLWLILVIPHVTRGLDRVGLTTFQHSVLPSKFSWPLQLSTYKHKVSANLVKDTHLRLFRLLCLEDHNFFSRSVCCFQLQKVSKGILYKMGTTGEITHLFVKWIKYVRKRMVIVKRRGCEKVLRALDM